MKATLLIYQNTQCTEYEEYKVGEMSAIPSKGDTILLTLDGTTHKLNVLNCTYHIVEGAVPQVSINTIIAI